MKEIRIIISAGGTAGHLHPAQQLAYLLKENKNCKKILFASHGLNTSKFFDRKSFQYVEIISSNFTKKKLFRFIFIMIRGVFQTIKLILSFRPTLVIGFGSYHSFPVLFVARCLHIPYVLYESNRFLGKVNRLFSKKARYVASSFKLENYNDSNHILVKLLPWINIKNQISKIQARTTLGLDPQLFTFLVFGGSQGAVFINNLFMKIASYLKQKEKIFQLIHLTGDGETTKIMKDYYKDIIGSFIVKDFEHNMPLVLTASDIVISRAGAVTINELLSYEKPSILIPFPFASEDHQKKNAIFMEKEVKGSYVFLQEDETTNFEEIIDKCMRKKDIENLNENIKLFKNKRTNLNVHELDKIITAL